jgi:hypothetical protein
MQTLLCVARGSQTFQFLKLRGCEATSMKRMLGRNWDDTIRGVSIEHECDPTHANSLSFHALSRHLRKPYRTLMCFVGPRACNAARSKTQESNWSRHKVNDSGNRFVNSRGDATELAAQQSLRLDLTSAGTTSTLPAQSGASRTQAPSRPRRLLKIQADAFRGSPMRAGRREGLVKIQPGVDGE